MRLSSQVSGCALRGLSGGGQRQTRDGPEPRAGARPQHSEGWQGAGYFASRCKAPPQGATENSRLTPLKARPG
ncbi:hypothetical protein A0U92_14390 [Acetobacter aceti]|uniref:Uncharacterized protein n=1 Tax=Acetobacter aceti TaxID=435 RepID=A0A1U9KIX2_ACEAC|nr:hypothetical protein A0U92_14390 [Acetobacter aceti]